VSTVTELSEFVDRYVAIWHEPDADLRRQGVAALWAPDGAHFIDSLSARGHDALAARVTGTLGGARHRAP
jgi:hypothetical protein